jgi:hypothetical protein
MAAFHALYIIHTHTSVTIDTRIHFRTIHIAAMGLYGAISILLVRRPLVLRTTKNYRRM